MNNIWKCWDDHYKSVGIKSSRICKDRIINLEHYNTANKKLLFVLKEVNDWEGGDICKMLEMAQNINPGMRYQDGPLEYLGVFLILRK